MSRRKADRPNKKKIDLPGSNINNTSPIQEKNKAARIHFFKLSADIYCIEKQNNQISSND